MKNFAIILGISAVLLLSCSSKSGSQAGNAPDQAVVTNTEGGGEESKGVKPEHLTKETFKAKVMDYEKNPTTWVFAGDKPCIVDFYADWCKPCKMIAPIMDELATEYAGQIKVGKLDVDSNRVTSQRFGIRSIPSILYFKDGELVDVVVGAVPKSHLEQKIQQYV